MKQKPLNVFTVNFFIIFVLCIKIWLNIIKKPRTGFKERLVKGIKIFLRKKETKSVNVLMNDV